MNVPFGVDFATTSDYTLGVEWEFALVDVRSGDLVNNAKDIISDIHGTHPELEKHVHREFLLNTIELVTGVTTNTREASEQLKGLISQINPMLGHYNVELFGAGTHPFAKWNQAQLTSNPRYEEMLNRTQWWGRQMLIWGLHVHVGISHRERVMPIISALLTYYPHLLALSASSPMWDGDRTGYASNRAMMFQQLPTAGLPFHFNSWTEFEEFVYDQTTVGIIDSVTEIRWDIRPVPRFGTIEVRVSDSVSTWADLEALVALTHCLIVWLDERFAQGEAVDQLKPWQVQENKWRAARYGLDAVIITDSHNNEQHIYDHTRKLVHKLAGVAERLGCQAELAKVMDIFSTGASYQRQERLLEQGNPTDLVKSVVQELQI